MKLSWQPIDNDGESDGKPVVLADTVVMRGPGSKVVTSSQFGHARASEIVMYPRAESVETFDRQNQSTTFTAVVFYEFAAVGECARFIARLANTLGGRGNLTITYPDGGSDTLPRAVWQALPVQPKIGVSAAVAYTFTGGRMNGD